MLVCGLFHVVPCVGVYVTSLSYTLILSVNTYLNVFVKNQKKKQTCCFNNPLNTVFKPFGLNHLIKPTAGSRTSTPKHSEDPNDMSLYCGISFASALFAKIKANLSD